MDLVLRGYEVNEATWFYLSLLLILAVYFRFNRLLCLRNGDLALLLMLAPGLILVRSSVDLSGTGYAWLFAVSAILFFRLILDPVFTRRPRVEPNLNPAGLAFLCASAFIFQMTRIMTEDPAPAAVATVRQADDLLRRQDRGGNEVEQADALDPVPTGPAPRLLAASVVPFAGGVELVAARAIAILSHFAVISGLIAVGRWHFADTRAGLAMATLYLLLPPTAYDVWRVTHVLPAALIVWAMALHARPLAAGMLLGLSCGTLFFSVFLLPLWTAFYWRRGALRFSVALVLVAAVLLGTLAMTSVDSLSFKRQMMGSIDWMALRFDAADSSSGFWSHWNPAYRIPVFALFAVAVAGLSIWPAPKTLEHLIAQSTAIVVGTQFWYPNEGGVYILWYLPICLLAVFRPRLNHLPVAVAATAGPAIRSTAPPSPGLAPFAQKRWS